LRHTAVPAGRGGVPLLSSTPVDLSGIIFVVLAVAWAVYLIPKVLKHHDEVARTRSIDRFSTAMRVLARREPVNRRDSRLVISPARSVDNPRVLTPTAAVTRSVPVAAVRGTSRPAARAAARAAARRRRRILSFLLLSTLVVVGLAAFAVLPWWSVSIPGGVTVLFLLLCSTQVRRSRLATWDADLEAISLLAADQDVRVLEPADTARGERSATRVEAPYGMPSTTAATVRNAQGFEELDPDEDTMSLPVQVLDAVAVPTVDGGTLWDPLPVTLPTYVTKARAKRTVRTIDLGEPGTWTSGRTAEDARLAAAAGQAATEPSDPAASEPETEGQRAVGS